MATLFGVTCCQVNHFTISLCVSDQLAMYFFNIIYFLMLEDRISETVITHTSELIDLAKVG